MLSVVVAIVSDTTERPANVEHLEPCLEVLCEQSAGLSVEIIVPYHSGVQGVAGLIERYPGVRFVKVGLRFYTGRTDSHEHHHELRSRGIDLARGEIVALTEDHGIPAPDWCRQIIEAHRQPFACIGGAIENAIDRPLNRAVCFCDFLRYQNPLSEGESSFATDANVAYKRAALMAIRPVWEERFYEPSVHEALRAIGEKIALAPRMVLYQHRRNLRIGSALKERFVWGRSYGASRGRLAGARWRFLWTAFFSAVPPVILTRMTAMAIRKHRMAAFFKTLPLTIVLTSAWAFGEVAGYITGRSSAAAIPKPAARPDLLVGAGELIEQNRSGR